MVSVIAKPSLCVGGKNKDLFNYQMTHNILQKYLHRFLRYCWNCVYFPYWDQVLHPLFACYYSLTVSASATALGHKHIGRERIIHIFYIRLNDWQRGHKITLVFCFDLHHDRSPLYPLCGSCVIFGVPASLRLWRWKLATLLVTVLCGACTLWWVATSCHLS